MNLPVILELDGTRGYPCHRDAIQIHGATGIYQNARHIKRPVCRTNGFSLVELTLALGVAALSLLVLLGLLPAAVKTQQRSIQQTTSNQIISQIYSFLRADVRLPPGQYKQVCPDPPDPNQPCQWDNLHGHWKNVATPDTLYFTNGAKQTGNINASSPPADAVFRAKITYRLPPSETTSVADITVTWPAAVDPDDPTTGVPGGSVTTTIAVNR
jgi:type II secretory pathway pseudopilin PulG